MVVICWVLFVIIFVFLPRPLAIDELLPQINLMLCPGAWLLCVPVLLKRTEGGGGGRRQQRDHDGSWSTGTRTVPSGLEKKGVV